MISIIVCSVEPARATWIEAHYHALLGDLPHEIIIIRDARSLAEGYNRGIAQARGDRLILSHDDIEFLDPKSWWPRLEAHLARNDLVGLAGTTRLIGAAWARSAPPYTFGQVGELDGEHAPYRALIFGIPGRSVPGIQACDGLFLAVDRKVVDRVRFDAETFDGFHCYDVDFTYSAHLAGFRLAVATDLPVLHASQGSFDDRWAHYAARFVEKYRGRLHPMTPRLYQQTIVCAQSKDDLLEILGPQPGM